MKLYSFFLSPFTSRVRIAIYAKNLSVEILPPPGGLGSDEYRKISPTGKIPALEIDGTTIIESSVICEFLEDRFPEPALLPRDAIARAHVRTLVKIADLYLAPPLMNMLGQLTAKERDAGLIKTNIDTLLTRLDLVESLLASRDLGSTAAGLSLADCALVPLFLMAKSMLPALGGPSPLEGRPKLAAWWEAMQKSAAVTKVLGEMEPAAVKFFQSGTLS